MDERRKHKRYKVREGAFAAIAPRHLIGQIKNISRGGVAFTCMTSGMQDFTLANMDIFTDNSDFYLSSLPFKAVYDIEVSRQATAGSLKKRQLSGQFFEVTPLQASLLNVFLKKFVVAEE